ncbi:MAG: 3-deoxy-manno-octulosonate cytidylyltransferase [bacterium]|nr:3-deoxy-manno-octulosonate cytidylyltransferase [Gammaproteobacteria bacterium]HIL97148.1 3-deoxy-manno-octulosonate cytidylyltransferase [Pseudomonadales bacterium]
MEFTVIIPARYGSRRLPRKALLDIAGKPMIQRVYEQACKSAATQVVVATDDQRIADVVSAFGGQSCMTSVDHHSGTDRIQEVTRRQLMEDSAVIVNVQGDEPLIPPAVINQVADNLQLHQVPMATLCESIESLEDVLDPNIVKVVTDENDIALYFSRAPIPWDRESFPDKWDGSLNQHKRHIGIYAYRVSLLNKFVTWPADVIEQTEKLEQLRAIRQGIKVHVDQAIEQIPPGIDTEKDLLRTREVIESGINPGNSDATYRP